MTTPPTGTVTFLFTDIEGSTRLWEERPDEMRAALAEHDALVRAAIGAHGGYVFSTGGDGFAVAFSRAHDAIDAARKAQAALADHLVIRVRMGIHTGEVQERDGDYFGPAVNRAARIMAAGHGGQVLLSQTTAELVADSAPLTDLGVHRLRDLGAAQYLFQLGSTRFPPVRSAEFVSGNLPTHTSSFIGRAKELEAVTQLVRADRAVTLTGVGGVGKTRLALQAAGAVASEFPDGAWLVELADVRSADELGAAVAAALGIAAREGLGITDSLVDALRVRNRLLVLDNCEHVLAAVGALVDALLPGCRELHVLATSREALGVLGERIFPVPSMSADSTDSDAANLFVDRCPSGRAVGESPEQRNDVVTLVAALDGIPLAIELAAARTISLTPAEILARLTERFRLLGGRGRHAHDRHQTLRATIDWSFRLLDGYEQALFGRLAVFVDGFTLDAAYAVANDVVDDDLACLDLLESLVAKSLVVAEGESTSRYRLLETMRQFGWEQLAGADEVARTERAHAEHFLAQARRWRPTVWGDGDPAITSQVARELSNSKAAIGWLLEEDRADDAAEIFETSFYELWGTSVRELMALAERIATSVRESDALDRKAAVLALSAYVGGFAGALDLGREHAERSLACGVRHPAALVAMGTVSFVRGELDEALQWLAEGVSASIGPWVHFGVAGRTTYGALLTALDRPADARVAGLEALSVAQVLGNAALLATADVSFMAYADSQGADRLRASVSSFTGGDAWVWMWSFMIAGELETLSGAPSALAASHFATALEMSWDTGNQQVVIWALEGTAGLALREGLIDEGSRIWGAARSYARQRDIPGWNSPHEAFNDWARALLDAAGEPATIAATQGDLLSTEQTIRLARDLLARLREASESPLLRP